jgi:U3 small nucleolar RNA-associated protein 3
MGKRRKTAKTGDKSLYKKAAEARAAASTSNQNNGGDDDYMYDDVDRYHNQKDEEFIKLNQGERDGSDDEEEEEAVMDLGGGGESSEEDEDSDSEEEEESKEKALRNIQQELSSSSEDEDDEEMEAEDIRDWGKRKAAYYHGDTADLEIGQDEEDAFLEEEAAKEVQAARYEDMAEEDFMLSDDDDDEKADKAEDKSSKDKAAAEGRVSSIRDISKLTSKDKRKLIEKQHPGLLQILSHFSEAVRDLKDRTSLATSALCDGEDDGTAEVSSVEVYNETSGIHDSLSQSTKCTLMS